MVKGTHTSSRDILSYNETSEAHVLYKKGGNKRHSSYTGSGVQLPPKANTVLQTPITRAATGRNVRLKAPGYYGLCNNSFN
jgi:hypothetical protein